MKLATRSFKRTDWYVTSPFGWRKDPITGEDKYHSGCDYGTHGQKWAQYGLEKGVVLSAGKDSSGAIFAWVRYPRLGIDLLHYHLDAVCVKAGQEVNENTIIGYTGTTGRSTGIHWHMGLRRSGNTVYIDPHAYEYIEYVEPAKPEPIPYEGVSDEELARRVWLGEFGNGNDRVKALGIRYNSVQALVNAGVGKPVPAPTGFKKGEQVVPTRLVSYTGARLVQYDKQYTVYEDSRNDRVVLAAPRHGKLVVWAAMNIKDVRRV
jgi:hypothetical protein